MTAQETFAEMLKERVAPAFRELGFKGSGTIYELRVPEHWAMLGFHPKGCGTRIGPTGPTEGRVAARTGATGGGQWWFVAAGQDTADLADALIWAIRDFGIPAMQQRIDRYTSA